MSSRTGTGRRGSAETAPYRPPGAVGRRRPAPPARGDPTAGRRASIQVGHDRSPEGQGVLVVERLVVGHAGPPGVDLRAAQVLGGDVLARGGLHQRRPAEEDRAGALDDHRLVAHRRHVRATGGPRAHHQGDLGDAGRRHPGLVVEDPAEVLAIREDLGLQRQERATAVDQVDARQAVLEGDLLGPEVLLDGHRVVGAALDRGVVGDDDARRALDPADAGDDARARCVVVVQPVAASGLSSRKARPGRAGGRCARGPAACRARDGARWTARRRPRRARRRPLARPQVIHQRGHRIVIGLDLRCGGIEPAAQDGHAAMIGAGRCHDGRPAPGPPAQGATSWT